MADGPIVCTNCGAPMLSRSCKVRCPRCGYFEDCSDTGLPGYSASADAVVVAPLQTAAPSVAEAAPPGPPAA
jgi:uncharacterized Zn finger protein (UPF0148 family)